MSAQPQIVVVGAGIVGASVAWHLAKAGAQVTVVDAGEAGGVATAASFAWINASWGNPEPYFRLRIRAMAEWRRLAAAVPGVPLAWTGALCWDLPPAELEAYAREHGGWGYGVRQVDRSEAQRIEPNLADPPDFALHIAEEGAVEPRTAALRLLADAERLGVRLVLRTPVTGDRPELRPHCRGRDGGRPAHCRRSRARRGRRNSAPRRHSWASMCRWPRRPACSRTPDRMGGCSTGS